MKLYILIIRDMKKDIEVRRYFTDEESIMKKAEETAKAYETIGILKDHIIAVHERRANEKGEYEEYDCIAIW